MPKKIPIVKPPQTRKPGASFLKIPLRSRLLAQVHSPAKLAKLRLSPSTETRGILNLVLKNRFELAELFNKLGFLKGAEIGVHEGRYSEILCQKIPALKLLCVDIWPNESIYQTAKKRLAKYKAKLIRKSSMEAVKSVPNESLDFVFIDADHKYDSVKSDIESWSKKVKKGGIVSGHDYYVFKFSGNRGVIDAVDKYTKKHKYKLYTTDQYWEAKVRDDRHPCWYFYKK